MDFIAIIPARAASTRLPNKPLADIAGKPMVVRTLERAAASQAKRILVATDDQDIAHTVRQYGYEACLTRTDHPTGTDRLAETVNLLELDDAAVVVNVQGDEPLIDPSLIDTVAQLLTTHPDAAIATCATRLNDIDALFNPHIVKAICTLDQRALYFSRAPIPWIRDTTADGKKQLAADLPVWHHVGLYAYRAGFLRQFAQLTPGILERYESLEQLRALEHGYTIVVHPIQHSPIAGVDTPTDLVRVRTLYAARLKASKLSD